MEFYRFLNGSDQRKLTLGQAAEKAADLIRKAPENKFDALEALAASYYMFSIRYQISDPRQFFPSRESEIIMRPFCNLVMEKLLAPKPEATTEPLSTVATKINEIINTENN